MSSAQQGHIKVSILLILVLTQIVVCSASKKRYCGLVLTNKVIDICEGCLHQEKSNSKRRSVAKLLARRHRRTTMLLTQQCCFNVCSEEDISQFCCTEEEKKDKYGKVK